MSMWAQSQSVGLKSVFVCICAYAHVIQFIYMISYVIMPSDVFLYQYTMRAHLHVYIYRDAYTCTWMDHDGPITKGRRSLL